MLWKRKIMKSPLAVRLRQKNLQVFLEENFGQHSLSIFQYRVDWFELVSWYPTFENTASLHKCIELKGLFQEWAQFYKLSIENMLSLLPTCDVEA